MKASDTTVLTGLREETEKALAAAIGTTKNVAIIDAPNQRNVGDTLIWAGELAYLRRLGLTIRYVSDLRSFSARALRRAMPEGVILLHGGGNFGDLWPGHQRHREDVVRQMHDYRIVQLPQSIYFQSDERAAASHAALAAHPDFRVLLRDGLSMERAARQLPDLSVQYCADMALGWDPPAITPTGTRHDVLVIARADHEGTSGLNNVPADWLPGARLNITDWHHTDATAATWARWRRAARFNQLLAGAHRRISAAPSGLPQAWTRRILTRINDLNIDSALPLYENAGVVVVDRLHAHIFAALLGIDHVVLDNSYGKLSAIYGDYSGRFSTAHYATSLDDARRIATELIGA